MYIYIYIYSPRLIFESIKVLEIKTPALFNLDFASTTVLSCFFFFFSIIDIYVLIPGVIVQIFYSNTEFVIHIGIPTKEAKAEMETYPVIVEIAISKWSM